MAKKTAGFTIRENELAKALEINVQRLDEIIHFFDADPNDQWDLKENDHFIYLNKNLNERLFSEQGAYAIAKYMDEQIPQGIWARIIEFITGHKAKIRNAFISQKILANSSSLTLRNNTRFISKSDAIKILCTSPARINKAFVELQKSEEFEGLKIGSDFDDFDGVRYYSLSVLYRISRNLSQGLTVKDRREWCGAIEVVGQKTFKLILDAETAQQKRIESAMSAAKKRDGSRCQITGEKRDKHSKDINIVAHHIYSKEHHPHLAATQDNLITLTQSVHSSFHAWNGGSQKPCTVDNLIQFVTELYPDNYDVVLNLNRVKKTLRVQPSNPSSKFIED